MTRRVGSYITRTKHGVYYFQIRVSQFEAKRLGVKSSLFRKSLGTKDKAQAIQLARRYWNKLERRLMMGENNSKDTSDLSMEEFLRISDDQKQQAIEKSELIRAALSFTERYYAIPKWDELGMDFLWQSQTPLEGRAMQWVSDEGIDLDEYRAKPAVPLQPNNIQCQHSELLSVLLQKYEAYKERNGVKPRSINLYRGQIQTFIDVVGDKESNSLSYQDVERFVECLPKIPRNRNKAPLDIYDLETLLEMSVDESLLLAEGSWKGYATNIRSFLSYFVDREFINQQALTALKGEFTKAKSYPYLEYEVEDLKKLFYSAEYLKGKHKKASNYWCPLIGLFTGARSNEICQLRLDDIKCSENDGQIIYYIDINQEEDKELKTEASIRPVPIHKMLCELGFLDYVQKLRKKGEVHLFPEINPKDGVYNRALSRWYGETYRPNCGVLSIRPDRRKVFHSFRHTLVQHLYDVQKYELAKIGEVVGHTHKTITGGYTHKLSLSTRAEMINSVDYGLDFSELRKWVVR